MVFFLNINVLMVPNPNPTPRRQARRKRQVLNFQRSCLRELDRLNADATYRDELQAVFARWLQRLV